MPSRSARRASQHGRVRSLAVLPLENLSPGPDEDFFADGMTDALITTLAQIRALRVISRTSIMRYKGARQPLPEIAQALNVDAIVEGTVLRSNGRVRISTQLIHAASDTHLWSKQYESDLRDVLTLQSDVARAIADEIQVQLSPQQKSRLAGSRPVDPVASESFLKGRHFWYRRSPDALKKAVEYCSRRSTWTRAMRLPTLDWRTLTYRSDGISSGCPHLLTTIQRPNAPRRGHWKSIPTAPRRTPRSGVSPHNSTGTGRLQRRDFGAPLNSNPSTARCTSGPHFLRAMDRTEDSLAESRRALECDPLGLVLNMHMGWHLLYSRQHDKAIEQCLKTLELDATFILAHVFLGQAYEQTGAFSSAVSEFERAVELSQRHQTYLADLGHGYAVAGRRADALRILDELTEMSSHRYVAARSIAEIHIGLNDVDSALAWLEKAFLQRNGWLIHIRENPRYDRLRGDPRYLDLVRRMNFPDPVR